jgi:aryl-phospho-beta-D-glucosidase BglC (GH1 family)
MLVIAVLATKRAQGQADNCRLVAQGSQIVNASTGEPVILRSVSLGNWFLQEGYMLHPQGCPGCPATQWQMKLQYANEGFSLNQIEIFYRIWRDNFITEADIEFIHSLGFNSVRLPMHYDLFLTDDQRAVRNNVIFDTVGNHDGYKNALADWYANGELFVDSNLDGFEMIDRLVDWCGQRGMYVILDLHAAPGAQGAELNICDGFFGNNLWDFPVFQDVLDELWSSISNRYKSEPRIAMYEFVNEPNSVPGGGQAIHALTQRLINTVRDNDDPHLICIQGDAFGNFYNYLEPFTFSPNWGLVYSAHRYQIDLSDDFGNVGHPNQINRMVDMINFRDTHNVPIWVGETGENSNDWLTQNIANIESAGIGWCHWTYKRHDVFENAALMRIGGNYPTDGIGVTGAVLNNIKFENCIPNSNTIMAVTAGLPDPSTTGCFDNGIQPPVGETIWIACNTGNYVSNSDGQSPMQCSLNDVMPEGLFTVVDAGNGKIALRGSNGLYVSSENGQGPIFCNRNSIDWWERFDWVEFDDGTIGFRGNNGRYISSENGGEMTCNRDRADAWEKFSYGIQGDVNCLLGDCDQNGVVNFEDIPAFIAILQAGTSLKEADCNQDDAVNFADIPAFIAILAGN